jgi:putative transposase
MDQRRRFVLEWLSGAISKTALCRLYGTTRQTGYGWAGRFEQTKKWAAIEERSRRPRRSPKATPSGAWISKGTFGWATGSLAIRSP